MIQTADFFPPMVDDPYAFGQIAAANALSDVYAMGGEPKLALNLAEFPGCLEAAVLQRILEGGADKVREAGASVAGGHTIVDDVPKYGLCVTGFVRPDRIWTNAGAKPGDCLILTKPIGSGILSTAVKAGLAGRQEAEEAIAVMSRLNRLARDCLTRVTVHACTDITGFGLIGHALEMAEGSGVTLRLFGNEVPLMRGALSYASMGLIPQGTYANRDRACGVVFHGEAEEGLLDLLYDPQTSGGLLASVPQEEASVLMDSLAEVLPEGSFGCIGRAEEAGQYRIVLEQKVHV